MRQNRQQCLFCRFFIRFPDCIKSYMQIPEEPTVNQTHYTTSWQNRAKYAEICLILVLMIIFYTICYHSIFSIILFANVSANSSS